MNKVIATLVLSLGLACSGEGTDTTTLSHSDAGLQQTAYELASTSQALSAEECVVFTRTVLETLEGYTPEELQIIGNWVYFYCMTVTNQ